MDEIRALLLVVALGWLATAARLGHESSAPTSRIAVMTIATGSKYNLMGRLAHKNHGRFADINGFDYIDAGNYSDGVLPGQWLKIKALIDYLPMYEWIMWMDADSLVCNWKLDIYNYMGTTDKDIVLSADIHPSLFNTGVFWIRNTTWSVAFMRRVLERGYMDVRTRYHGYYEQLAMQDFFRSSPDVRRHFLIIPNSKRHEFNSYIMDGTYRLPGMGVIHDAGCRFRIDPQECQRWFLSYYCMCTMDKEDDECTMR